MESFAHINVLLAAYGGASLTLGVIDLIYTYSKYAKHTSLEGRVLVQALCGCGAALLLLPLLAAHAAHAVRASRRAIHIIYACAMAAVVACQAALLGWLAHRNYFVHVELNSHTDAFVWASLAGTAMLAVLELGGLAHAVLLARSAAGPSARRVTSPTAWKPM